MTSENLNLNLIQLFSEISNTLNNLRKPVNIFDFAVEKDISTEQAQFVLNSFILQSKEPTKFIIIFRAEILEFDETNKLQKTTVKFFPNYFENLRSLVAQSDNEQILDFGIYCIFIKIDDFALNDYSVFAHEMRQTEILNLDNFQLICSNQKVKENLSSFGTKNAASKNLLPSGGKASVGLNNFEKNFQEKVSVSKQGIDLFFVLFINC